MSNRLSKITTRTGDDGTTGLGDGSRVPKNHLRIAAIGDVDELNSGLGVLLAEPLPDDVRSLLVTIQHELFNLGGELAIPGSVLVKADAVARLEVAIEHYNAALPRLAAVTWGAEDLSTAIGAVSNREESGQYSPLYDLAGSLCLAAAAATGVSAIDTIHADFRDAAGLTAVCRASRRRGFRGRMAIHPDQVAVINEAYSPTQAELAHARRIVEAFAAQPDAGALNLDGVMIDKPHLVQARRTLGLA
mgnify:CR=1 FL=1